MRRLTLARTPEHLWDDQELSSALPIHGQAEQTDLATRATCSERGGPGDSPRESAAEQRGESIAAARDAAPGLNVNPAGFQKDCVLACKSDAEDRTLT